MLPRLFTLLDWPVRRHARASLTTGPARGIECFESDLRDLPQHAAYDEDIATSLGAANCPHPWQIARFQKDDQRQAGEWGFAIADRHFDRSRAQPAHAGALAEQGQTSLHPAHECASGAHIPDRAGGEPGDDRDRGDSDELRHGGPNDSTTATQSWRNALREFLYGMTGYEFAQQALEMRASMERLFMLGLFGEIVGVPIIPPYYGLRLLPFVVPQIETWKRQVLRERELGSDHEHHLHGL
jgi:hypothetical protein